jgi:hypothetical protein
MPEVKIDLLPNAEYSVDLETGEKFKGAAKDVIEALGKSKVETRRHYEAKEAELKTKEADLAARENALLHPATPVSTPADQSALDFQKYVVDQTAKGLGYANGDEYKAHLQRVAHVTGEMENQAIAGQFLNQCQDFPNTPEAIAALSKKLDENKWDYTPQSMIAAHSLCLREDKYKALTPEEINSSWASNMQASSRRPPPPMIQSGSPDNKPAPDDAWSMPLDTLRKKALAEQGR